MAHRLRSIKVWLNVLTMGALFVLIVLSRQQIGDAFSRFGDLNYMWLLLILPLQLTNYYSVSQFYKSYLGALDEKLSTWTLYKIALEMNFVNNVFPTGGASGFGYLGLRLRKEGVQTSKSAHVQLARHALTFLSFILYLLLALLLLALVGQASRFMVLVSSIIILSILFVTLVLVFIISSSRRITAFTAALPRALNKVVGKFRKGTTTIDVARVERLFLNFHEDYVMVSKDWRRLIMPFRWTMLMNATEIATIFVVYLAFGEVVNIGALIIAYAVANIAGLISVLPGGVGVYEGLMTAVMSSAGVVRGLALSATVIYRVVNMTIFLPLGFFFYQRALVQQPALQHKAHVDGE